MFFPRAATGAVNVTSSPIEFVLEFPASASFKAGMFLVAVVKGGAKQTLAKNSVQAVKVKGNLFRVKSGAWINPSGKVSFRNGFVSGEAQQLSKVSKYDMKAYAGFAKDPIKPNTAPKSKWKLVVDAIFGGFDDPGL